MTATLAEPRAPITQAHREQFQEEGYFVLEGAMPAHHLKNLLSECQRMIDECNAEMDRQETNVLGLNHRDSRYFLNGGWKTSEKLRAFVFSEFMADVCRATLGPDAFFFLEQYVVKAAEKGMKFGWHQDSGYVGYAHRPYLTCWCPLVDVTEENGSVYLLPFSQAGGRDVKQHILEEGTNDKVGYFGDNPGIPVIAPAGSLAIFSSTLFHRSGPNTTHAMRPVYLVQYTAEPLLVPDGSRPLHAAEPFVADGKVIARAS